MYLNSFKNFIILVHILFLPCLGIKCHSNGFAILHTKMFKNLLKIPNLVYKLSKNFFFHLQKFIFIITHQNEIIDINDNEKFDIYELCNIHIKIRITPQKFNVFQRTSNFSSETLEIISSRTMTCEVYTQNLPLLVWIYRIVQCIFFF